MGTPSLLHSRGSSFRDSTQEEGEGMKLIPFVEDCSDELLKKSHKIEDCDA